jgi:hypothetical protein
VSFGGGIVTVSISIIIIIQYKFTRIFCNGVSGDFSEISLWVDQGDLVYYTIAVGEGCTAVLATQASTKVHFKVFILL